MLPLLYVFLKRMLGSSGIAACGTVIFAFDFIALRADAASPP